VNSQGVEGPSALDNIVEFPTIGWLGPSCNSDNPQPKSDGMPAQGQNLLPRYASVMEELARIPDAKGAQPPRRFMIDEMTVSTNGRRLARSTSVTGRHGRRG
jgi:hypothetical protein